MKRVYVVNTPTGVEYVRAHNQASAISAIATRTMTARPARVEDVLGLDPARIIDTGADAEATANAGGDS